MNLEWPYPIWVTNDNNICTNLPSGNIICSPNQFTNVI
jgi:hypothetical protein